MNSQNRRSHVQQQTLPFSGGRGASNMAPGPSPLTLETLVIELEKSRKSTTAELTASLNAALAPINSALESITTTVAKHTSTITEMETALSAQSDSVANLELEVAGLRSELTSITEEHVALQAAVEDLVSRSKRQNLRVIGLPEDIEGNNPRQFMADLFKEVAAEALDGSTPELDRAHRSLRPKPRQGSRPVIVRFHRYIDKERVLLWAKEHRDMTYRGHNIKFYEDFSAAVAKKRAAFNQVKASLYKKGIRFGMIFPARLRITFNGVTHIFDSPEQAEQFYEQRILDTRDA